MPQELEDSEELSLWQRFAECRDGELRARLVERHLPLARAVAASLYAKRVSQDAEFADYAQYGTLGLIEAVDSFDWRRGVRFSTFAGYRIEGSIRTCLANFSEHREQSKLLYRLKKERAESIALANDAGERRRRGVAGALNKMADITVMWALSYLLEDSGMVAPCEEAHYVEHFYDGAQLREVRQTVITLVDALPDQERRVVKYHYFHNLDFTEIADIFGLSKGRISQIHKRALMLLREARAIAGGLDLKL